MERMEFAYMASYLTSWWSDYPSMTIDWDAYNRFLDWLAQPQIAKPRGCRSKETFRHDYTFEQLAAHMAELATGRLLN